MSRAAVDASHVFGKYFLASSLWTVRTLLEPEMSLLLKEFHASISCEDWSTVPFIEMAMEEIRVFIGREEEHILKATMDTSKAGSAEMLLASPLPQKQRMEGEAVDPLSPLFQESSVFYQSRSSALSLIWSFISCLVVALEHNSRRWSSDIYPSLFGQ